MLVSSLSLSSVGPWTCACICLYINMSLPAHVVLHSARVHVAVVVGRVVFPWTGLVFAFTSNVSAYACCSSSVGVHVAVVLVPWTCLCVCLHIDMSLPAHVVLHSARMHVAVVVVRVVFPWTGLVFCLHINMFLLVHVVVPPVVCIGYSF